MASWQRIQSHTVAGPRRPLTDFPVQPNGCLSLGLSPTTSNDAAFDPRKFADRTWRPREVNLPSVPKADAPGVATTGERISEEILAPYVEEVVYAEAQPQAPIEHVDAESRGELGARA